VDYESGVVAALEGKAGRLGQFVAASHASKLGGHLREHITRRHGRSIGGVAYLRWAPPYEALRLTSTGGVVSLIVRSTSSSDMVQIFSRPGG